MTTKERLFIKIHTLLSRSRTITNFAIKLRNQCNQVINRRYSIKDMSPALNGEHLLLDQVIPLCKNYFDIGANKGEWTSYLIEKVNTSDNNYFLYEPGNVAYAILTERFKGNSAIHLNKLGLSDTEGKIVFYEQDNAGELSSAIENWAGEGATAFEVETTTVDYEFAKLKINYLDYLKIDTEGFDLKVLKGATGAIQKQSIGFIQFEYNSVWALSGSTLAEAYRLLENGNYTIFLIQPNGLYNYDIKSKGEFYAFSNFIAVSPANLIHLKKIIRGAA